MPPSASRAAVTILVAIAIWVGHGVARAQSVLPNGGQVVAGSATIGAPVGGALAVTQTSNRAVVNWNGFSIGQPNSVTFAQPSSSAAILNRVTGATPSTIAGQLSANGQVFLVNPNGIALTKTGAVAVGGGFVASTLAIANSDFMAGNLAFSGNGASAAVTNAGTITAGPGGFAALIGGTAGNSGIIQVPLGKVALGSGERATLDLNGDGFMQIAAPTSATTAQGQALVSNSGQIAAPGGTVMLQAATVATAIRDAVNMSGVVAANSVSGHNGAIVLGAGPGGTTEVTGKLDVSAPVSGSVNGGAVTVSGAQVSVGGNAVIDARGARGGAVLVGVTAPGGIGKAAQTTIAPGAQILASGNPAMAGSGGHIETSGDQVSFGGAVIDAGNGGSWLLDPTDLTIDAAAAASINTSLGNGTNVTQQTSASGSGGAGDINLDAALAWSTSATLTLSAYNNINIASTITISGAGKLVLTTDNASANPNAALNFEMGQGNALFTGGAGSGAGLTINGADYTLLYDMTGVESMNNASVHFALAVPIANAGSFGSVPVPSFAGTFNGLGNTIANLTINDSTDANVGLFGQNSGSIANFGLVGGLVAGGGNAEVGALAGLNTGTLTNVYTTTAISGGNSADVGGLVGRLDGGTISSAYATGMVSGASGASVGGLVGHDDGGAITNAYATGAVSGGSGSLVGGLVGQGDGGSITDVYATGAVSGGSGAKLGGLVGNNSATISNGYWDTTTTGTNAGVGGGNGTTTGLSTAQLSAGLPTGFLPSVWGNANNQTTPYLLANPGPVYVGSDAFLSTLITTPAQLQAINDNLSGDYALANDLDMTGVLFDPIGAASGFSGTFDGLGNAIANLTINDGSDTNVGLFGQLSAGGMIKNVGLIGGSVIDPASVPNVGELVGLNTGTITNAFATGTVIAANAGPSSGVGGLVGLNNPGGTITNSYATGVVVGGDGVNIGGLVGINQSTISNAYATGAVTGGNNGAWVGGLVGENDPNATITNAYATGKVSGGSGSLNDIGGLVGFNAGVITNTYAAGAVVGGGGGASVGGLVGFNGGTVTDGYWNEDRAGTGNIGVGFGSSAGVSGLSAAGMSPFAATSYGGFTFTNTGGTQNAWIIVDSNGTLNGSSGGTLPMLAFEFSTKIQNAHQLQLMAVDLGDSYTLARNIDASATGSSTGATTGTDVWGPGGFVPVGGNAVGDFTGVFNGAGNTIANLTVNADGATPADQFYAGLFGHSAGTIENVGLLGGSVTKINGGGGDGIGALVGYNDSSNGTVSNSYATTAVDCASCSNIGGLVGFNDGTLTDAYAMGAVRGGGNAGGLVGFNGSSIIDAYATGPVIGIGNLGGLVGSNAGTITDGYYDAGTTGRPLGTQADGSVGETTAALQAALPTFVNPGNWGIVPGETYPYLAYQFPGSAPQVISGVVYTGSNENSAAAGAGIAVSALVDGSAVNSAETAGTVATGANGYYYYLLAPGTIPAGGNVLTYVDGALQGAALVDQSTGNANAAAIYANTLHIVTPAATYSTVQSDLAAAVGNSATAANLVNGLANLTIDAASSFTIDQSISYPNGSVTLNSPGTITETTGGAIDPTSLLILSVGSVSLTGANTVDLLAAQITGPGSSLTFNDTATNLAIDTVGGVAGITTNGGAVTLSTTTSGNITLNQPIAAGAAGVMLNSAGTISETTGAITAATLSGNSVGGANFGPNFGQDNSVVKFGPFSDSGGDITLVNGQDLTVVGPLNTTGNLFLSANSNSKADLTLSSTIAGADVTLFANGNIIETAGGSITATNLVATTQFDTGGALTLDQPANVVTGDVTLTSATADTDLGITLAAGAISFDDQSGFTIAKLTNGGPSPTALPFEIGIATAGSITAVAGGDLAIGATASVTGGPVALATTGNFVNAAGSAAVSAGAGDRWLIYSKAPAGDTFGNLDSGNTAVWNATFASLPPASVNQAGNRYIFALQPTLTITTTNLAKTYGDDDTAAVANAFSVSGLQAGVAGAFLSDTPASVYTGTPAVVSLGAPATANVAGSPYAITASTGSLTIIDGYVVSFANQGKLTVTPAALTITASDQSKIYGQTLALGTTAFAASGLQNGDTVGGVTLASAGAAADAGVAGSPYPIVPANATGAGFDPANYAITYANGKLTVTPAALTITASDQSKIYGQTLALGTTAFAASGLQNGDTVGGVTLASAGAAADAGVAGSPYPIVPANATGAGFDPANYAITFADGKLTVTPAALTITASDQSKIYGQALALGTTAFAASGLQNGDTVGGVTLASAGAAADAGVAGSPYPIVPANATGAGFDPANYAITYANGKLTVTPAALTITASDQSKIYGQTLALGTTAFAASGLQNGDTVGGVTLASAGAAADAGVAGSPYPIVPANATGAGFDPANYAITFANGKLTVTPAALTITASDQSKIYGQTLALGTTAFAASGLQNGDTVGGVTLASAGAAADAGVAGSPYPIVPANATGAGFDPANYAITYANGKLTVTPAALTITASDQSKIYGQTLALGTTAFAASGLQNGDTVGGVTLASAGAAADAGVAGSPYPIVPANATGAGFDPANYAITYANGKLTVTPAALTAGLIGTVGKVYDDTNAATRLSPGNYMLFGVVGGDNVVLNDPTSGTYATANVGSGISVSVSGLALSGSGAGNYILTSGSASGNIGTISPAPLTVAASNLLRGFGEANPPLTYSVIAGTLFGGDMLTGALATTATQVSAGGLYPITRGTLAAPPDYVLTFIAGALTVLPPSVGTGPTTSVLATLVHAIQPVQPGQSTQQKPGSPEDVALAAIAASRAGSCNASSPPPALFVVLPSATGKKIGGIVVTNGKTETVLDQSFAAAETRGGALRPCQVSKTAIDATFRRAVMARPMLPHHFRLYLTADHGQLTPESLLQYRAALADIARRRAYQVEVIGYTDSLGTLADDRRRSLAEASAIRNRLIQDKIDPGKITITGRGKLDPLIPTADQVAAPRNRRIEIWVR